MRKRNFEAHALSVAGMERAREKDRSKTPMQDTSHSGLLKNYENELYTKTFSNKYAQKMRTKNVFQIQNCVFSSQKFEHIVLRIICVNCELKRNSDPILRKIILRELFPYEISCQSVPRVCLWWFPNGASSFLAEQNSTTPFKRLFTSI